MNPRRAEKISYHGKRPDSLPDERPRRVGAGKSKQQKWRERKAPQVWRVTHGDIEFDVETNKWGRILKAPKIARAMLSAKELANRWIGDSWWWIQRDWQSRGAYVRRVA